MRRLFALVAVFLVFVATGSAVAVAQEGRPGGNEAPLPEGVSFEHLAQAQVEEPPPTPVFLDLVRITLGPGASVPIAPDDPPLALVKVESGELTIRFPSAVEMLATPEVVAWDTHVVAAGDSVSGLPGAFGGELRNDGSEPAVLLVLNLFPTDAEGEATPGATPAAEVTPFAAEGLAGVILQPLAFGRAETLPEPDGRVDLVLGRMTFEPGAVVPPHPHCGGELGFVESGSPRFRTVEGPALEVARGLGMATPFAEPAPTVETVGPGSETTLGAGDAVFVPPGTVCEVRAVGDEPAVILVAFVDP